MLGNAERVERDAGVDAAACRCQERGAPAHAEAERRNFAAAEDLRAQPLHCNSGIIRRALPVEGVEPLPAAWKKSHPDGAPKRGGRSLLLASGVEKKPP